jgi:hypothetical protein
MPWTLCSHDLEVIAVIQLRRSVFHNFQLLQALYVAVCSSCCWYAHAMRVIVGFEFVCAVAPVDNATIKSSCMS